MQPNSLKEKWNSGSSTLGLWITHPNPVALESIGQHDVDYLCLDLQHGLLDYSNVVPSLQALQRSPAVPIARAPWNEPGIIGKLLDAGTMGVIVPMVNSGAEASQAVASCRYAPEGSRSYGPTRAAPALGGNYFEGANREVACIPMVETVEALNNLDEIVGTAGVDAIYVGPADLSISLGLPPGSDHDDQRFDGALKAIVDACQRHGVAPGIHTVEQLVPKRLEQGFQMITVTSDIIALNAGIKTALAVARGQAKSEGDGSIY